MSAAGGPPQERPAGGARADERRARSAQGWESVAAGWGRRRAKLQGAAQAVSLRMVEAIDPQPGQRVLELAAGPGDTGFLAAELIAPAGGALISSDRSAAMREVAAARAAELGLGNVEHRELDLEWIDLPAASVDAVLCRWGYMLVPDPEAALRETRRVLRPGGRLALAVWDAPERNPWSSLAQREAVAQGLAKPPEPGEPGMFSLAEPGLLERLLADAGFAEVAVEAVDFEEHMDDVDDWIATTTDLSPGLGPLWRTLDERSRAAFRDGLAGRAAEHTAPDGSLALPARSLVASAIA